MLTGCPGGNEGDPSLTFVSTRPAAVVLRPGETDHAEATVSRSGTRFPSDDWVGNPHDVSGYDDPIEYGAIENAGPGSAPYQDVAAGRYQACAAPGPDCALIPLSAASTPLPNLLAWLSFVTKTGVLNYGQSTLPVNIFPATPDATPPVIRFAAGGPPLYADSDSNPTAMAEDPRYVIDHSLALTADGEVWAWGNGSKYYTVAGDGKSVDRSAPVQAQGLGGVVAVDAGNWHSLELRVDGTVWSWGNLEPNAAGLPYHATVPSRVGTLNGVVAIAAGGKHSLALKADGTVWAWGANDLGQLGNASAQDTLYPVQVQNLDSVVRISAGDTHSLALKADGTLWAWGSNLYRQLGPIPAQYRHTTLGQCDGHPFSTCEANTIPEPVQVAFSNGGIADIDAGGNFSLALTDDGRVWAWGSDVYHQLGISGGASGDCGLLPEFWGYRAANLPCGSDPVRINGISTPLEQITQIAGGGTFGLARRSDGTVWAWGDNRLGQVAGIPGFTAAVPVQVPGLSNVASIAAGGRHALALVDDCAAGGGRTGGRLLAWGDNRLGARGDGTGVNWLRPTPVLSLGDDATCSDVRGYRLIIYKSGQGGGTIQSNYAPGVGSGVQPGLRCTGLICWQNVEYGATVTLTASPDSQSQFGAWLWDCADSSSVTQTIMAGVKHCKVRFDPLQDTTPVTLDLAVSGAGRVTSLPSGIDCGSQCTADYANGSGVALTAVPDTGWVFTGWGGDCTGSASTTSIALTVASQCTATFAPTHPQTVSLLVIGQGTVSESATHFQCTTPTTDTQILCTVDVEAGQILTLIPHAAAGYHWNSWGNCSDNQGASGCVVQVNGSLTGTVIAEFVANSVTHDLSVSVTGSGTVSSSPSGIDCGADCSETYPEGTLVSLAATAAAGYQFDGWGGDCSGTGINATVTMDADRLCSAQFSAVTTTHDLAVTVIGIGTVTSSPAGIDCGADCIQTYSAGTSVVLTATPSAGNAFNGWSGDCASDGTSPTSGVVMDADRNCTATFITAGVSSLAVSVTGGGTVTSDIPGIDCGTDCYEEYTAGQGVGLTAVPNSGWLFDQWTGDCVFFSSNPTFAVATVRGSTTCNAFFVSPTNPVTLTLQVMGDAGTISEALAGFSCDHPVSGGPTTTCTTTYSSGMDLVLVANTGSGTDWWQGCDQLITVDATRHLDNCGLQINADTTVIVELR